MNTNSSSAREHWRRVVAQQESSGLSVTQFCRRRRIAQSSLFAWKRRLAEEGTPASATTMFVQLKPASAPEGDGTRRARGGAIELHVGQGRHLVLWPGFDAATLAAVLAVLGGDEPQAEGRR